MSPGVERIRLLRFLFISCDVQLVCGRREYECGLHGPITGRGRDESRVAPHNGNQTSIDSLECTTERNAEGRLVF